MARSGDTFVNAVTGFTLRFVKTSADTDGQLLEVEATYPPQGVAPPAHFHPRQEEHFEVLRGAVRVRFAGEIRDLHAGEVLVVPPGVPHAMWNATGEEASVRWQTRPALRTEDFFVRLMILAKLGRVNASGAPGLLDAAVLFRMHQAEVRLASPPERVQRLVFGVLAPVARALGRAN